MGAWPKGTSGNPGGRSRKFAAMARRILELSNDGNELVDFLFEVVRNKGEETKMRVHCAEILLDRGLGKVPQTIDFDDKPELTDEQVDEEERLIALERIAKMTPDERLRLLAGSTSETVQ